MYDNSGNLFSEKIVKNGTTSIMYFIYKNNELIGSTLGGNQYVYYKNIQGDIIGIINNSGTIVAKYVYDAWGNHTVYNISGTIGDINPFRYRSYYYDTETEYYYLKTRYYVPKIGRFLNLDSIEYLEPEQINGLNLYAYCLNNPVMNSDPDGTIATIALLLIGAAIGGVIGGGASIISQGASNGYDKINFGQVVLDALFGAVSGLVASTGITIGGSVIFGGMWSGLQTIVDNQINGRSTNGLELLASVILGAVGGLISGPGADVINNNGIYKTGKEFLKAGHHAASKNLRYQAKNSSILRSYITSVVRYSLGANVSPTVMTPLSKLIERVYR